MPLFTALSVGAALVLALIAAALAAPAARQRPGGRALLALVAAGALLTARAAAFALGWAGSEVATALALALFATLPPLAALYARGALGGVRLSRRDAVHAAWPLAALAVTGVLLARGPLGPTVWGAYALALQAVALGYGAWTLRLWRASRRPRWTGGVLAAFGVHWALSAGAWAASLAPAVPAAWGAPFEAGSMAALVGFGGAALALALRQSPTLAPEASHAPASGDSSPAHAPPVLAPAPVTPEPAPYAHSGMPEADRQRLARRLREAFDCDRLHLDPELSAGALADAIGATPRELSEVLTRELGQSFFEAVAARRVEEATRRLADPAHARATILEVLHASGFNSKSAFHRAFRAHVGQTPSAYRREALGRRRQAA